MKKTIFMTLLVLFSFFAFSNDVYAACAAGVTVGEERLCLVAGSTGSNAAGTASVENGVLVLKNYNGGYIRFDGANPFGGNTIKLVGDNYITNESGYGILSSVTGLNFVGDGTLTIKSKLPFVAADFTQQNVQYTYGDAVTTIKITAGEVKADVVDNNVSTNDNQDTSTEEVKAEDNASDDNASESDSSMDLTTILLIVSSVISVLCLIIVVVLLLNNKKSKSSE